jgi:undecaprenyl-diphosphatase
MPHPRTWDARLHALVGAIPASPADRWLRRLSNAANHGRIWVAIAVLLGLKKGSLRRGAIRGLGSLSVSSVLVNLVLKRIFGRVRPDLENLRTTDKRLRREPGTLSFPSGHSASAAAFAAGVAMENSLAGAALVPVAAAVGYSRVHVGVHYPGDVVAGFLVGGAVAVGSQHWWRVRPTDPARVRPAHEAPGLPDGDGLVVAVNPRSGTDDYDPAEEIRRLLPRAEIREISEEHGVTELLQDAARSGAQALGVAGGDGSVAAAAAVALEHELPLAVVPAGTLNHFARDVGVDTPEDAADAIRKGSAVYVDVAEVNGTPFLNTASIGVYPQVVERRDALSHRMGKWVAMTVAAAQVLRTATPLDVLLSGKPAKVWILFVGNCCYTPRGLAPAWRPRLEDGLLDVQYLRADVRFSRTRAVLGTLLGISDRSAGYKEFQAESLDVVVRSGGEQVAYDGETGDTATEFRFRKGSQLTVYCCRTD